MNNTLRQSAPAYFIYRWRAGLELQDKRIRDDSDRLHAQIDIDLYALILRNLVRAIEYAEKSTGDSEIKKALEKFKVTVPGWLNVRDFLEHFDEYSQGKGNRQKDGKAIVYGPYYAEEEQYNPNGTLIQKNYYLSFGEGNQIDIATTTREAGNLVDAALGCLLKAA